MVCDGLFHLNVWGLGGQEGPGYWVPEWARRRNVYTVCRNRPVSACLCLQGMALSMQPTATISSTLRRNLTVFQDIAVKSNGCNCTCCRIVLSSVCRSHERVSIFARFYKPLFSGADGTALASLVVSCYHESTNSSTGPSL